MDSVAQSNRWQVFAWLPQDDKYTIVANANEKQIARRHLVV
jgi:hypothetical protein